MLGGTVGSVAHRLLPGYTGTPGAYALVGMGTAFAGIVRAPMTSVVMIFEVTRNYAIIVPLMISNLVSFLSPRSYNDNRFTRRWRFRTGSTCLARKSNVTPGAVWQR